MSESKANVIPSMKAVINAVYPVGSYYWSDKDTSPEALFGVGTWEQITDRFVYAAGTKIAGSTGGEETHTLTQSEIPNYKIGDIATIVPPTHTNWNNGGIVGTALGDTSEAKPGVAAIDGNSIISDVQYGYKINSYGGGQAHNNMPPYIVAYCWHRTA